MLGSATRERVNGKRWSKRASNLDFLLRDGKEIEPRDPEEVRKGKKWRGEEISENREVKS